MTHGTVSEKILQKTPSSKKGWEKYHFIFFQNYYITSVHGILCSTKISQKSQVPKSLISFFFQNFYQCPWRLCFKKVPKSTFKNFEEKIET